MAEFKNLMPIRTKGTKPPLFVIHGEPLQIAFRIRADRPLYGVSLLYHPELGRLGDRTPASIEEFARLYLEDVRRVQPHGPYYFCGYSAGGMIAFEMASQLLEAGELIGDLTLVEPTVNDWNYRADGNKLSNALQFYLDSDSRLQAAMIILKRGVVGRWKTLQKYGGRFVTNICIRLHLPLPQGMRWTAFYKSMHPLLPKYQYQAIDCKATLVYCAMGEERYSAWYEYWQPHFLQHAKLVSIEGSWTHRDLMTEASLGETIRLLDQSVALDGSAHG